MVSAMIKSRFNCNCSLAYLLLVSTPGSVHTRGSAVSLAMISLISSIDAFTLVREGPSDTIAAISVLRLLKAAIVCGCVHQ